MQANDNDIAYFSDYGDNKDSGLRIFNKNIGFLEINLLIKILSIWNNGADPDLTDEFVNIYQTAREKNLQSLDVMVAREEEFNSSLNLRANFRGCTALHYAALADDYESIRILLGLCNL